MSPDGTTERPGDGDVEAGAGTKTAERTYGGVIGAYPYAFRRSDSRLFRSYVAVGGLLAVAVVVIFGTALVTLIANTVGTAGGTFTFVRTFYVVVGLLVVVPLMAPILLVARRHRRSDDSRGGAAVRYDRGLAAAGYLFVLSLYLTLVITAPAGSREAPPAALAPVVETLYSLPPAVGAVPPLAVAGLGYLLHRRYR